MTWPLITWAWRQWHKACRQGTRVYTLRSPCPCFRIARGSTSAFPPTTNIAIAKRRHVRLNQLENTSMTFSRLLSVSVVGLFAAAAMISSATPAAEPLPIVAGVELQPIKGEVARVVQALEFAGAAPLTGEQKQCA